MERCTATLNSTLNGSYEKCNMRFNDENRQFVPLQINAWTEPRDIGGQASLARKGQGCQT